MAKKPKTISLYGLQWSGEDEYLVEREFVIAGGHIERDGQKYGNGIAFHFKRCMVLLYGDAFEWHPWAELLVENWITHTEIGIMGPSSSGKTFVITACTLAFWLIHEGKGVTVLISSVTKEGLKVRVWNALTKLFTSAKKKRFWLAGRVIPSAMRIELHQEQEATGEFLPINANDAIIAIAAKTGGQWVGLSNYVGIKNNWVLMVCDEASLMPRGFLDSTVNLRNQKLGFKVAVMGNPKDTMDPLGQVCEPAVELGGWESFPMQEATRTWKTRARSGIAIQLCGYDTPNWSFPDDKCPYPFLLKQGAIEEVISRWGKDSYQFITFMLGVMPVNAAPRRIITIQMCEAAMAFEPAVWESKSKLKWIVSLDPSYSGIGGDRCVLTPLVFGPDVNGTQIIALSSPQVMVPVNAKTAESPEDQIAKFCKNFCEERKIAPSDFAFDSTGRGTLMSSFSRFWSNEVVCIEFGGKASKERFESVGSERTEQEAYGNKVTALWYSSRLLIENGQVRGITREMASEGALRKWDMIELGRVIVESKEDTKETMGRSPDLWDSFVCGIELARMRGFKINEAGSKRVKKSAGAVPWFVNKLKQFRDLQKKKQLSYN